MTKQSLINEVNTSEKMIAVTFDDGPNPVYTTQLLDIFSEVQGKATFFMIGEQMNRHPEIVRKVYEQGHEIGNHTYSHAKMTELAEAECVEEVIRNEQLIYQLTGQKPVVLRPPYLDYNHETVSFMQQKGYPMIGALNLEAHDWEMPGVNHILSKSRECVKNGSILIFHDGYGDRSQSIEAVRILVSELKFQGYQLVTVSELLRMEN
ncbi:polysaccharide deacetylase family protein [Neobacillus cucumis]|uniref:polysaccharide deacetylase family protein n=1 Tax=Neobacillus cucumis TaxID=1740721 RepID=UPI001FDB353A|nr:polysaccharide deacetylase family protein [Neobacillus cucumis]MBM7654969.1 peptidoglycan/xylan/chitin deacetylase (PgdA/CDA1 family) [Neobacillus cucumis]